MSILDLKFDESHFAGKDIQSLSDTPSADGMSADELKKRFDMVPKVLIAMGGFNALIDMLHANGAEAIGINQDLANIRASLAVLTAAEGPRAQAELERIEAEIARMEAEARRNNYAASLVSAEEARVQKEIARVQNEITRDSKEAERQNAENLRVSAENIRRSAETARNESETTRQTNEVQRVADENARLANESRREEFGFKGQWLNQPYKKYNMVEHNGNVYFAPADVASEPPNGWVLLSSEGRSINIGGTFESVEQLNQAYPSGDVKMYTVNNMVYAWVGNAWVAIGSLGGIGLSELAPLFDAKVDKVDGKGLSTNDFTDTLKASVEDYALALAESRFQGNWSQYLDYKRGERVYDQGAFYECFVPGKNSRPGWNNPKWKRLSLLPIVDNLHSTNQYAVLSAAQGNALNLKIIDFMSKTHLKNNNIYVGESKGVIFPIATSGNISRNIGEFSLYDQSFTKEKGIAIELVHSVTLDPTITGANVYRKGDTIKLIGSLADIGDFEISIMVGDTTDRGVNFFAQNCKVKSNNPNIRPSVYTTIREYDSPEEMSATYGVFIHLGEALGEISSTRLAISVEFIAVNGIAPLKMVIRNKGDMTYTTAGPAQDSTISGYMSSVTVPYDDLFQSVVSGKQAIATAINDLAGSTVANSGMTHQDLSVVMRNNIIDWEIVYKNGQQNPKYPLKFEGWNQSTGRRWEGAIVAQPYDYLGEQVFFLSGQNIGAENVQAAVFIDNVTGATHDMIIVTLRTRYGAGSYGQGAGYFNYSPPLTVWNPLSALNTSFMYMPNQTLSTQAGKFPNADTVRPVVIVYARAQTEIHEIYIRKRR